MALLSNHPTLLILLSRREEGRETERRRQGEGEEAGREKGGRGGRERQ
jgi:hypothetical protein